MATDSNDEASIFRQLDVYPWEADAEFQSGLVAIRGSGPFSEQAESLLLRAQCFYYARKYNIAVDFDGYQTWRAQQRSQERTNGDPPLSTATDRFLSNPQADISTVVGNSTSSDNSISAGEPSAPYPTSFSQIVDLITTGQPIPGVKEVPEILLTGQESQPTTAKRKKPWEQDDAGIVGEGNGVRSTSVAPT